jgi:diguanylate cyclase (GGDEF)-like protein/PAS domain S-box-containing protein
VTLRGFGCDIAQGYHIARPAPVEIFDAWRSARAIAAPPQAVATAAAVTPTRRTGDAVLSQRDLAEPTSPAAALRTSEERFRALFTQAPIGIAEARSDGILVAVNPRLCTMLGYDLDELIGQPAVMISDVGDRAGQARDMATLSSSDGYSAHRLYRRKDGTTFSALVSVAVVRRVSGAVHRMVAMVVDVSELTAAQHSIATASAELAAHQMFTDSLLASADAGIIACDSTGRLTITNRTARIWHGLDPDIEPSPEQLAHLISDLFEADGVTPLSLGGNPLRRACREGTTSKAEMVIAPAGGLQTRVMATGTALHAPSGEPVGAVVTMHDITVLHQRESELRDAWSAVGHNAAFHDAVLAASPDVIFVAEPDTNRNVWSSRNLIEHGYTPQELQDLGDNTIDMLVHPDDRFRVREQNVAAQALPNGEVARIRYRIRVANDGFRWFTRSVTPFARDSTGRVTQILGLATDVTEVVQVEQRLADAALHDVLTGLPNRTLLGDRLGSTLARTSRSGHQLAVLYCDLDGFKTVNDIGGHGVGDVILVTTAKRLLGTLRAEDTAARVGGDEFVIILEPSSRTWAGPDGAPIDVRAYAVLVAERVKKVLAQPVEIEGHDHALTATIGIAFGHAGDDVEELLAQAEAAMYRAKFLGKDRYEIGTELRHLRAL